MITNDPVVVVGGGLAGLVAAATVARSGHSVAVIEKLGTPGGQARSTTSDGFVLNRGPHALYRAGAAYSVLFGLGVSIKGAAPPMKSPRITFDGVSHLLPVNPTSLARTSALGTSDKLEVAKVLARLPKLRAEDWAHRSVTEWIDNSVTRSRPRQLMEALVRLTTYSNAPDQLSADVAIGQIQIGTDPGVSGNENDWSIR